MKKWLRRILIATALVALTLGVLYEMATHVGRGWLRGEAFFEGRPTSYWRPHCDEWLTRFETPEKATRYIPPGLAVPILDDHEHVGWASLPPPSRPPTFWSKLLDRFRPEEEHWKIYWPPKVLLGFPGAEPVLEELVQEEKYRVIAERALRYNKFYRVSGGPTLMLSR
ncbi:MAG: hypothetical protein EXR98_14515 [Gemmataceae bacterium]|nr:hypothetical protein [Gemmataceae bacterium]